MLRAEDEVTTTALGHTFGQRDERLEELEAHERRNRADPGPRARAEQPGEVVDERRGERRTLCGAQERERLVAAQPPRPPPHHHPPVRVRRLSHRIVHAAGEHPESRQRHPRICVAGELLLDLRPVARRGRRSAPGGRPRAEVVAALHPREIDAEHGRADSSSTPRS